MFVMNSCYNWCFCVCFAGKRTGGKHTLEATPQVTDITDQSLARAGKFHMYYKPADQRGTGTLGKIGKRIQPVMSGRCWKKPPKKWKKKTKRVPSILIGVLNLKTLGLTWAWPAKTSLQCLEHSLSAPTEKNKQLPPSSAADAWLSLQVTPGTAGLFHFLPHKGCHTGLIFSFSTGSDFQKV